MRSSAYFQLVKNGNYKHVSPKLNQNNLHNIHSQVCVFV